MRSKSKLVLIATLSLLALAFTFVSPASASVTGGGALQCTVSLPAFPGAGSFSCPGTFVGGGAGIGSTASTLPQGAYAHAGSAGFLATGSYSEPCVSGEPPLIGLATGTATISGLGQVNLGDPGPATLTIGSFSWVRVGLTAVITTSGATGSNGASSTVPAGAAVAAFAPLLGLGNVCPAGAPLTAIVAGAAVLPA